MTDISNGFGREEFIEHYRRLIALRDGAELLSERQNINSVLALMESKWNDIHGTDDLHEVAFLRPSK